MRAGKLDRRVTLQRKTSTQSASGAVVETWTTVAGRRWASVMPVRGDERFTAPQYAAKEQVEFRIRWSQDVADLTPLDRIVYPALADESPEPVPAATAIYDILAVHEIGRREGLRVLTYRRSDT